MDRKLKVYFAGPDVFRQNPQEYFDEIALQCVKHDIIPMFPFDALFIKSDSIYLHNLDLLNKCDIVLANIIPFRGPSVDPGTAFEIGYAKSLDKPVVGYTSQLKQNYKERVTEDILNMSEDYPYVENFGLIDNLMIAHACDFIFDTVDKSLATIKTHYNWLLDEQRI